jgi:uncharacterized membrane protein YraQ (UPF0718 family)
MDSNKAKEKRPGASTVATIILCILVLLYLAFSVLRSVGHIDFSGFITFNTIFISILMQAFPFMLLGALVSAAIHVFIPDGWLVKAFPLKHGLGFLTAMFAGLLLPVCECAIVPVMTRLVKKGVSLPVAVTFMLSAPIINPIVIVSTLYAFPGSPEIAAIRVGLGLFIALLVGIALLLTGAEKKSCMKEDLPCEEHCACCDCAQEEKHAGTQSVPAKINAMLLHAGEEFFSVGKYLVIGAFLTSIFQTAIPSGTIAGLSGSGVLSLLLMMALAFLFSVCSTSDAFIARSFVSRFPVASVMGFIVFGPMMDLKNLLMLSGSFKKSFVFGLALLISALNFTVLLIFSRVI